MTLSQMPFALGARGGLARILIPSAMNTTSKERVNWPARPLIRNLNKVTRWPRSVTTLRAACVAHAPTGRGDADQVNAAHLVLDDDHGVDAPQQHGVYVEEVGRKD